MSRNRGRGGGNQSLRQNKKGRPSGTALRSHPCELMSIYALVHDRHRVFDRLDDLADVERLAEEAVEAAARSGPWPPRR